MLAVISRERGFVAVQLPKIVGNSQRGVLRCGRRSKQILERIQPQYLALEHISETAGYNRQDLLHRGMLPGFELDGGDRLGQSAGNNQLEVIQVGGDVQGETMRADAARYVNADGGNLAFA